MVMLGSFVLTCKVIEPTPPSHSYLNHTPTMLTFPFFWPIDHIFLELMMVLIRNETISAGSFALGL
jgi:hypothetical protein